MAQDHNCNCFGQRLISSMRAAALPAVLGMLWHAPCVAQEFAEGRVSGRFLFRLGE